MDDIKTIREALGLTQVELAQALGLHQTAISRMERGESPITKRTRLALMALVANKNLLEGK